MQQHSRWAAQSLTLLVMMGSLLYKTRASLTGNPSYSNSVNEQHEAVSDAEGGNGSFNMLQGEMCLSFIWFLTPTLAKGSMWYV